MKEIWKDIKDYEGLYQINNLGIVKSLNYARTRKEKTLKFDKVRSGYYLVSLCKNKIKKRYTAHRLVALAFIDNPNNYPCVNHKDGNKINNNIENLEWCTYSMNIKHALKIGLLRPLPVLKGEQSPRSKFKEKDILNIRKLYKTGNYTQRKLAKIFNTCCSQICYIVNKKQWTHI